MRKNIKITMLIILIAVLILSLSACEKTEKISLTIVGKKSTFYNEYDIPKYNKQDIQKLKSYNFSNLHKVNDRLFNDVKNFIESEIEEPINSEIIVDKQNKCFNYLDSKKGYKIDEQKLYNSLIESLPSKNIVLTADYVTIDELITKEDNINKTILRGSFTTNFNTSSEGRKHNIKLSGTKINGTIINPKEKFSFNEIVGNRNEENGFKIAKIIANGQFVDGVGGGVCQVSTTLYNACLLSGLNIVSASQHSLPVSYVKPSYDAMVSSASDLVIENNTDHPIYIFCDVDSSNITFRVYGEKLTYKIVEESKVTEIVPYTTEFVESGETRIGKNGIKSYLKLIYFSNDKKVFEKIIRKDYYKPQNEIALALD